MASKTDKPDSLYSPYRQMTQKLNEGFSFILEKPPLQIEAAKVIIKVVASEYLRLRYTTGDDATAMLQAKRNMSDTEFGNLIKNNFYLNSNLEYQKDMMWPVWTLICKHFAIIAEYK